MYPKKGLIVERVKQKSLRDSKGSHIYEKMFWTCSAQLMPDLNSKNVGIFYFRDFCSSCSGFNILGKNLAGYSAVHVFLQ